jgi:predicted patatin/cPLA2 family phospholipase
MSIVIKENMQYIDGGTLEATPIQEAINRGATEIDVIVLREENPKYNPEYVRNLFHGIIKVNELMWAEINRDDIRISQLSAQLKDVKINVYYTPRRLTNNSLVFDHEIMTEWWKEGYAYAEAKSSKSFKVKCKK